MNNNEVQNYPRWHALRRMLEEGSPDSRGTPRGQEPSRNRPEPFAELKCDFSVAENGLRWVDFKDFLLEKVHLNIVSRFPFPRFPRNPRIPCFFESCGALSTISIFFENYRSTMLDSRLFPLLGSRLFPRSL